MHPDFKASTHYRRRIAVNGVIPSGARNLPVRHGSNPRDRSATRRGREDAIGARHRLVASSQDGQAGMADFETCLRPKMQREPGGISPRAQGISPSRAGGRASHPSSGPSSPHRSRRGSVRGAYDSSYQKKHTAVVEGVGSILPNPGPLIVQFSGSTIVTHPCTGDRQRIRQSPAKQILIRPERQPYIVA